MSPRTGRPTKEPKKHETRIRMSDNDIKKLKYCAEETGLKMSEVIRIGILKMYKNINHYRKENVIMEDKYEHSFEVDADERPIECPICGYEFDYSEDVDISQYREGFRAMLECPKCYFKKVLSYNIASEDEDDYDEDDYDEDDYDEDDYEPMSKEDMLREMEERDWYHELTKESSLDEVEEEYNEMLREYSDDETLFPNGRDYDAEDEDGPF